MDVEQKLEPGTVIAGRYRIDRELGHGAMGTVYRGEHLSVGRSVAIKVLSHELAQNAMLRRRFRAEARAASAPGHPNIVEVFDAGELDDGRPFLVMELLHGRELLAALRADGPMDIDHACRIIRDVARGLHAAHEVGIVHRDLKAENVFLVERDGVQTVKILDFGIAHGGAEGQRVTTPGLAMGTPEYMAPEAAYGASVSPAFDIYALGVLLFELLTGEPPITAPNPMEVLARKAVEPPPRLDERRDDAPAQLVELVDACLQIEPEHRPQTAAQVAERLDAILEGRSRTLPIAAKPNRVDTWGIVVAIGVVIVAGAGIAWAYASEEDRPGAVSRAHVPEPQPQAQPEPEPDPDPDPEPDPDPAPDSDPDPAPDSDPDPDAQTDQKPKRDRKPLPSVTRPRTRDHASQADEPEADSARCRLKRRQAHEARDAHDWTGVLRYTKSKQCWPGFRERDKLRVKAYMELQRFDRCVEVGGKSMDPDVSRWVELCTRRAGQP